MSATLPNASADNLITRSNLSDVSHFSLVDVDDRRALITLRKQPIVLYTAETSPDYYLTYLRQCHDRCDEGDCDLKG